MIEIAAPFAPIHRGLDVCGPRTDLDEQEIRLRLPMYRFECMYLRKAALRDEVFESEFATFRHPFTVTDPRHLTREHVLAYVTQASYVFVGLLCDLRQHWGLNNNDFIQLALDEQTTFTRIEMRFRKFVRNRDGITMRMTCNQERFFNRRLFLRLGFEFPDGCDGTCEGIIAVDHSLRVGSSCLTNEGR